MSDLQDAVQFLVSLLPSWMNAAFFASVAVALLIQTSFSLAASRQARTLSQGIVRNLDSMQNVLSDTNITSLRIEQAVSDLMTESLARQAASAHVQPNHTAPVDESEATVVDAKVAITHHLADHGSLTVRELFDATESKYDLPVLVHALYALRNEGGVEWPRGPVSWDTPLTSPHPDVSS